MTDEEVFQNTIQLLTEYHEREQDWTNKEMSYLHYSLLHTQLILEAEIYKRIKLKNQ